MLFQPACNFIQIRSQQLYQESRNTPVMHLLHLHWQVSNWFINARVRLWKPMIEEMYEDLKKASGGMEGV
jgi:hypothetical protein